MLKLKRSIRSSIVGILLLAIVPSVQAFSTDTEEACLSTNQQHDKVIDDLKKERNDIDDSVRLYNDLFFMNKNGSRFTTVTRYYSPLSPARQFERSNINADKAKDRDKAILSLYEKILDTTDVIAHIKEFEMIYRNHKDIVYEEFKDDVLKVSVPAFIYQVFEKAHENPGWRENTRIVFLRAGAEPLATVAKTIAAVDKSSFPADRIHSIWATMENYQAMRDDPMQAMYFVKYLYDEGILTPETKHLLFVDTDSRVSSPGTELIIYKTLLNPSVMNFMKHRFGLSLPVWNSGNGYEASLMYMSVGDTPDQVLSLAGMKHDINLDDYRSRMRIFVHECIFAVGVKKDSIKKELNITNNLGYTEAWVMIDNMSKLSSVEGRLKVKRNKVIADERAPYYQFHSGRQLAFVHDIEYSGLIMACLDYLESKGFDVSAVERHAFNELEQRLEYFADVDEYEGSLTPDTDIYGEALPYYLFPVNETEPSRAFTAVLKSS